MIHIIVYSTTNTVAKMYKNKTKQKKNISKLTQEEENNGWDSWNTPPKAVGEPTQLCM